MVAYMFRFDYSIMDACLFFGTNIIAYTIEMKHIIAKRFSIQDGEIGPVEIEHIFGFAMIASGLYFSPDI